MTSALKEGGEMTDDLPGMLVVAKGISEQRWPHTMDARVWAEKWAETLKERPQIATDPETMLAWFSNAIMAGYDTAQSRSANGISEAVQRADAAERIADIAAIELVRSCAAPCGDGWLNPRGEDLEPELAYAVKRGLVVSEDGLLRFTELAWERAQYLTEEAP